MTASRQRTANGAFHAGLSRRHCLGLALGLAAVPALHAQPAFPARPLRIVPFGTPGGPIDILARAYGEKLQQRFGQPVIVETKPGASGILAADLVAKAPADGHTVFITLPLTHIHNAILQPKLPYDPVKDFEPLSELATGGPVMIVPASMPVSNLKEFVAYAKTRGRMTYGTWGTGSSAHLFGEAFKRQAGLQLDHVPYKGESAAHLDMFGGQLDLAWANPGTAKSHGAKVKVLGITGTKRIGLMPDVATFTEQGFTGFDLDSWLGVYTTGRTPKPVVDQLARAWAEITRMPDIRQRLLDAGMEPWGSTADEFARTQRNDYPRWEALIKGAGVTTE
jgi:tripartite-type tricarboxylate transporter receptor subunit TctC